MSTMPIISQAKAKRMVQELTAIGDRLEADNDPAWYEVARAAASLEALRLGLLTMEPLINECSEVAA